MNKLYIKLYARIWEAPRLWSQPCCTGRGLLSSTPVLPMLSLRFAFLSPEAVEASNFCTGVDCRETSSLIISKVNCYHK